MQSVTRLAAITGANRGLGRSIALHVAGGGRDVVGTSRSRRAEAEATARGIAARGRRAVVLPLDVSRAGTLAAFTDALAGTMRDAFGRQTFDHLVNNAGSPRAATSRRPRSLRRGTRPGGGPGCSMEATGPARGRLCPLPIARPQGALS